MFIAGFASEWFSKYRMRSTAIFSGSSTSSEDAPLWDEQGHDPLSSCLAVTCAWMLWRRCLRRCESCTSREKCVCSCAIYGFGRDARFLTFFSDHASVVGSALPCDCKAVAAGSSPFATVPSLE